MAGSSAVLTVVSIPRQTSTAATTGRSQSQNVDFTRSAPRKQAWRRPLVPPLSSNPPRCFAHRPGSRRARLQPRMRGPPESRMMAGLAAPGSPRIRRDEEGRFRFGLRAERPSILASRVPPLIQNAYSGPETRNAPGFLKGAASGSPDPSAKIGFVRAESTSARHAPAHRRVRRSAPRGLGSFAPIFVNRRRPSSDSKHFPKWLYGTNRRRRIWLRSRPIAHPETRRGLPDTAPVVIAIARPIGFARALLTLVRGPRSHLTRLVKESSCRFAAP